MRITMSIYHMLTPCMTLSYDKIQGTRICHQDLPERMKKLRDELPIKSENPLSMQLGFELIDSFEFHRYLYDEYLQAFDFDC